MDAVLDGVSETHARLNGLRRSAEAIEQLGHLADVLRAQVASQAAPRGGDAGRGSRLQSQTIAIAEELRRKVGGLAQ